MHLVRQRTALILSFQNLVSRNLGRKMNANAIKKLNEEDLEELFEDQHLLLFAKASISTMHFFRSRITHLEKAIHKASKLKNEYKLWQKQSPHMIVSILITPLKPMYKKPSRLNSKVRWPGPIEALKKAPSDLLSA